MFGIYRFVLAMNVVIFHILDIPNVGPYAVYSFFILSGFLMTAIMHKTYGYTINGIKAYSLNRFLRLFPVYWFLLFASLTAFKLMGNDFVTNFHGKMGVPESIPHWLANLTLIYPSFTPGDYELRVAPATWALTIELFFYFLIGLGISRSKFYTLIWFFVSLLYIIIRNVAEGGFGIGYGNVLSASLPFSLGAMLFHFKDQLTPFIKSLSLYWVTIIFFINLVIASSAVYIVGDNAWKIEVITSYGNIILSSVMLIKLHLTKTELTYLKNIDQRLGDLSYPLYVFHWTGACIAVWQFRHIPLTPLFYDIIVFVYGLFITLFISYLANRFVGTPIEMARTRVKRLIN